MKEIIIINYKNPFTNINGHALDIEEIPSACENKKMYRNNTFIKSMLAQGYHSGELDFLK